jgi:hypothetical protein
MRNFAHRLSTPEDFRESAEADPRNAMSRTERKENIVPVPRRRKKGLPTGALGLLAAGGTAVGIFAATSGTANAALGSSPSGGPVPLFINDGPASIPDQTNSIGFRSITHNSVNCVEGPFDVSGSIDSGAKVTEGDQIELVAYSDGACEGVELKSVGYKITYDGPEARSGNFTKVLVRILHPALFVCTDDGWADNRATLCRDDG